MDLEGFVKKTLAYGDYFEFPLSPAELHYWLITSHNVSFTTIKKYLPKLTKNEQKYRQKLEQNTREKEAVARSFVKIARLIPGIRLIALTGSVAANNSKDDDDIDLMFVTSSNLLWIIRPLVLFILSFGFKRRFPESDPSKTKNYFCPNLWLDCHSLAIPKRRRNLYTAHEVLQVKPLFDRGDIYQRFIRTNKWTKKYLANAYRLQTQNSPKYKKDSLLLAVFAPINYVFYLLQYLYMIPKITSESITLHSAYFHKNDISRSLEVHLKNKSV